jgi:2-succinyl-6-hydroxy-2,4-cyclohexadiene-1-carboxylate synthase
MSDWTRLPGELAAWSRGSGRRLVFVHGFTQTANAWKPIAAALADDGLEAVIVDAPGHGESAAVRLGLPEAADVLAAQLGRAVYIGYSMGGRLCLHVATRHPEAVAALALVSSSPGIADPDERAARRAADDHLADYVLDVGVDRFLDEWLAQPLFAGLDAPQSERADRLRNTADGLAGSLRLAGAGAQDSLWSQLPSLDLSVLTLAGEQDAKYVSIARQIASEVRRGTCETIANAGHAVHLQNPDAVVAVIRRWLDGLS